MSKIGQFLKRAPEIYKALTAALVSFTALEGTIAAVALSTGVVPEGWVQGLVAVGVSLTGLSTWWVKNKDTVENAIEQTAEIFGDDETLAVTPEVVTAVVEKAAPVVVNDVSAIIEKYRAAHPD